MGQVLERGTQMEEDLGVHLRDPRLRYVQYDANLSHGEFLIIVQGQEHLFPLGELVDGCREVSCEILGLRASK